MSTRHTRLLGRLLVTPAVVALFVWMIVPLVMTLWFSTQRYNLLSPGPLTFIWFQNYVWFVTDPAFLRAIVNTLLIVLSVLAVTVTGGIALALLLDQAFVGRSIVRLMVIAPFLVMPTVSALIWKNLLLHPISGLFAWFAVSVGAEPVDWFATLPMFSIIMIITWQWLPFATLILLTALQSLDGEQREAAQMDGARGLGMFAHIILPHLGRAVTVVILIETIFLLSVFAEIRVTTNGAGGVQNLPFLIYKHALLGYDVGMASAGGIIAVILANIIAYFLVRLIGRTLEA